MENVNSQMGKCGKRKQLRGANPGEEKGSPSSEFLAQCLTFRRLTIEFGK